MKYMQNEQLNTYLFNKKNALSLDILELPQNSSSDFGALKKLALSVFANSESLGYALPINFVKSLSKSKSEKITEFWKWYSLEIKKSFGYYTRFEPLYPNFPKQVIDADSEELLTNALKHYSADSVGERFMPRVSEKMREKLDKESPLKEIKLYHHEEIKNLFVSLLNSNASLSAEDMEGISLLYQYFSDKKEIDSDFIASLAIEQKEILAYFSMLVMKKDPELKEVLKPLYSSPTDILRVAVALSGGDVSLAVSSKFQSFSRAVRRDILGLVEYVFNTKEDKEQLLENMFSYQEAWKKLSHSLHSNEYNQKFPQAVSAIIKLRNNERPQTFNSKVDQLIDTDMAGAVELLSERPGVFARNLNRLLQKNINEPSDKPNLDIVRSFEQCAASVATPVLLQLHSHFKEVSKKSVRVFMPKGGLSSIYEIENKTPSVNETVAQAVVQACETTLINRFQDMDGLGRVYVDPQLQKQFVSFAQRSASKALKTVTRGSRFEMAGEDIIRLFLGWSEKGINDKGESYNVGRVDIDLSCLLVDKDYKVIDVCSFYNIRNKEGSLVHSGDVTSAPNGAAEYIDIDRTKLNPNVKYVAMIINSYTSQNYKDLPACFAGWMERTESQKGQIFEYSTVKNKVDLTAESTQLMPAIFDIDNNEFIWADMSIKASVTNTVGANEKAINHNIRAIVQLRKPNLYDLFLMHAKARGTLVNSREEADTIFSLTEGITPYMFEVISSQFLVNEVAKVEKKLKMK